MKDSYFVNYYQLKNHKQRYKIKKLLYKAIGKMSNQNTKKSPGIEVALFNCTGDVGMDNFGCLNISFSLNHFYFLTNLKKKIMAYVSLQLKLPLLHTIRNAFSRPPFPPSERTSFMDDPIY